MVDITGLVNHCFQACLQVIHFTEVQGNDASRLRLHRPRAMGDVADLTAKTYELVRLIPLGMVTTYGGSSG